MRLSSLFAIFGVFVAAALMSLVSARFAVAVIEGTSKTSVLNSLDERGLVWAEVDTDGLQVYLSGTAPSEAARFSALSTAGSVVEATRVIDQMLVEERQNIAIPKFSMEILRNDGGLSLIGLIPASMDRDAFVSELRKKKQNEDLSDFLEAADYPAPETWNDAITYALRSLTFLESAKISLSPERIAVTAITASQHEKASVEEQLVRLAPDGFGLSLDISAPRPVITPFTLRFLIDESGPRFDACAADTEQARERILAAAQAAGMVADVNCPIGLGVPTPRWSEAVAMSVAAVAELGQGTVTFSDADISILAVEGTEQALFDNVIGGLENELPDIFSLKAVLPDPPDPEDIEELEFTATLSPEGLLQLRGRLATPVDRTTVDSFAMARFTTDGVDMRARVDDGVPDDWTYRVITGLDALSHLSNGIVSITPDSVAVSGATGEADANTSIAALLADKLGDNAKYDINVRYQEALDPVAALPTPEECEAQINVVKDARKITFEPGSARLDVTGKQIMDDIADILRECGALTMEIGGHTDSQGREVMNQQLSQSRAQTVLNELRMRRVLTGKITAVGYGESEPIADNDTEEGREANRRIEFKVLHDGDDVAEGDEVDPQLADAEGAETTAEANTTEPEAADTAEPEAEDDDSESENEQN
ncbi:MAG: OmpA family protein [Pseudomonadota bacterium]